MRFRRSSLSWLLLVCLLAVGGGFGLIPVAGSTSEAPGAYADADWPQLGHDAQRTNHSPRSVDGPYRFYWRWTEAPLASRIQPVVSAGRLFIGGLNGVMYALDAAHDAQGGSPRVLWRRELLSPIRAGAGVDGDVVVVGTHHGTVYGLAAASGQPLWSVATGGAILAAPALSAGVAFIGSASGSFYAIRAADGAILWRQSIGVPILGSAALSADGRRVLFMAENAVAYALASDTGAVLWRTQLQGQSGADRWPVVLGDLAIFRGMPTDDFQSLLHREDDVLDRTGPRQADWSVDWAAVRPAVTEYFTSNPHRQTLFAVDVATGQPRGVAPVLYAFGNNDPPSPPVAHNQALYVPYRPRHGIQNDSRVAVHVTSRYDAEIGLMDPTSLDIAGLTATGAFGYHFRLTSDEPAVLTMADNLLLVDNWERLGGIRLSEPTGGSLVGIAQVAHNTLPCNDDLASNDVLMPFYESCPFAGPPVGEGQARSGAVVGAGRIFWRAGASGLAAIGPANGAATLPMASAPPPAPAPERLPGPSPITDEALAAFVWAEPPRPIEVPADLRQRLEEEVARIVGSEEHLLPFYLERGFHGRGSYPPDVAHGTGTANVARSNAFWFAPSELITTLATAYPYLNPEVQGQVRSYLRAEMARFSPLQPLPWPPDSWLEQGRARELYAVPLRDTLTAWPPPGVSIQTLYALWAYARYTGDWAYISENWESIQSLFDAKKGEIDSYAEIAGAIGYARLAKELGYAAEASAGEAVAVDAMRLGISLAQWLERANTLYPADARRPAEEAGRRAPVFLGLTPEVGHYLRATNLAAVERVLDDVADYPGGSYLWYATRLGLQAETGESSYHSPEIGWSVFLAQAYVRQASQEQLRYWLDRPWGLGDLWYLQKLIATMEAPPEAPYEVILSPVLK